MPRSTTGAELLFEVFSQRYERGSVLVTTNLPFDEWTDVFGSERLTHHVHILEMNGDSYRLKGSRQDAGPSLQTAQKTSSSYQNGPPLPPVTAGGGTFPMSNSRQVVHFSAAHVVHFTSAIDNRRP